MGGRIDDLVALGYEESVERLMNASDGNRLPDHLVWRYHHEQSGLMGATNPAAYWLYKLIGKEDSLTEKMALFWHGIFATGYNKLSQGRALANQIRMFREFGRGNFRDLLVELSKDPAMIAWLDNNDNHRGSINENYGRELLELFSMGVGHYSEDDIKEAARAFTGWTIGNTEYMALRAERDSIWPYGRLAWHYEYKEDDHDDGEKHFLGESGYFGGEDIEDIIVKQPATARFIARHMYSFFVKDEPAVPQWPYVEPQDPEAIDLLEKTYFESGYDIESMLKVLLTSDFFRSRECWYKRIKNPPSVEGWHEGLEWVDTGTLVERINFSSGQLGQEKYQGVKLILDNISNDLADGVSGEDLLDRCLEELGYLEIGEDTRVILEDVANEG